MISENKTDKVKYYLGVDWGAKKTGLAIADSETRIATGLEEVKTSGLHEKIEQLIEQHGISGIIIGTASHKLAAENSAIKLLDKQLRMWGVDVELQEEFFSTKLAQQNLAQAGGRGISKFDDIEAARIILQSWLDK